jgi:hypothetical protein
MTISPKSKGVSELTEAATLPAVPNDVVPTVRRSRPGAPCATNNELVGYSASHIAQGWCKVVATILKVSKDCADAWATPPQPPLSACGKPPATEVA